MNKLILCRNCSKNLFYRSRQPIYCNSACRAKYKAKLKKYLSYLLGTSIIQKKCLSCNKTFISSRNWQIYCSRTCYEEYHYHGKLRSGICPRCNANKTHDEMAQSLCSKCLKIVLNISNKRRKNRPHKAKKIKSCLYCHKNITHMRNDARYCCMNHNGLYKRHGAIENNPKNPNNNNNNNKSKTQNITNNQISCFVCLNVGKTILIPFCNLLTKIENNKISKGRLSYLTFNLKGTNYV